MSLAEWFQWLEQTPASTAIAGIDLTVPAARRQPHPGAAALGRADRDLRNELNVMPVDVTTTPTVTVGTPKQLFKLPGPLGGNLGNISRDGQRFVFTVNVSAAAPTTAPR
jgi:hypothetical protein